MDLLGRQELYHVTTDALRTFLADFVQLGQRRGRNFLLHPFFSSMKILSRN